MQACGRLIARMREQNVDCDIGAGIELDGGAMVPVTCDFVIRPSTIGTWRSARSARTSGLMS